MKKNTNEHMPDSLKHTPDNLTTLPHLTSTISTAITQAKQQEDRAFIHAIGRGMLLLSAFENASTLTHLQLCEETQLPKATVSRLLHTLQTLGMINKKENDTYGLGNNLLKITANLWHSHDLATEARPRLKEFAMDNKVSVNIATELEGEMHYLACYRSPARLAVNLTVGSNVPIDKTAIGRAYFATLSPARQQQVINTLPHCSTEAEKTTAFETLKTQAEFFHNHGYCLSDGDYSPDILAVAVPLYDPTKREYTHALNASVPKANWEVTAYITEIVPKLKALALRIEGR